MANTQLTAGSAAMDNNQTNSAPASAVSPKGILKNKLGQQESCSPHLANYAGSAHENSSLTWDKPDLALNNFNQSRVINIVNSSSVNLDPTSKHFWTRIDDNGRSIIEHGNTRQVFVQPPVGPCSTAGVDALDDEDDEADLDPDARAQHNAFTGPERDIMERELAEKDDTESDVAAMSVEECEDIALFPSSKSRPNGAQSIHLYLLEL
ncbi:hypothetical protein H4Q26_013654, partial [Puccinia striiformis f. sp. tritici PST-130]